MWRNSICRQLGTQRKAAWEALANLYQQTSTANLLQLKKQLAGLVKQPAETITQYLARAQSLADDAATGARAVRQMWCWQYFGGLPSEYSIIRTVIENTVPLPSLAEMQAKLLLVEKQHHQQKVTQPTTPECTRPDSPTRPSANSATAPKTCWYCDKKGA